jgi:hypothetical protein
VIFENPHAQLWFNRELLDLLITHSDWKFRSEIHV